MKDVRSVERQRKDWEIVPMATVTSMSKIPRGILSCRLKCQMRPGPFGLRRMMNGPKRYLIWLTNNLSSSN